MKLLQLVVTFFISVFYIIKVLHFTLHQFWDIVILTPLYLQKLFDLLVYRFSAAV